MTILLWQRAARVTPEPLTEQGCWMVQGVSDPCGYMRLSMHVPGKGKRLISVHRAALGVLLGRPLLPGETVDHRCLQPGCWNPDHLEILSLRDNLRRRFVRASEPWALPDAAPDPLQLAADRAWCRRGRRVKRCPF